MLLYQFHFLFFCMVIYIDGLVLVARKVLDEVRILILVIASRNFRDINLIPVLGLNLDPFFEVFNLL